MLSVKFFNTAVTVNFRLHTGAINNHFFSFYKIKKKSAFFSFIILFPLFFLSFFVKLYMSSPQEETITCPTEPGLSTGGLYVLTETFETTKPFSPFFFTDFLYYLVTQALTGLM